MINKKMMDKKKMNDEKKMNNDKIIRICLIYCLNVILSNSLN